MSMTSLLTLLNRCRRLCAPPQTARIRVHSITLTPQYITHTVYSDIRTLASEVPRLQVRRVHNWSLRRFLFGMVGRSISTLCYECTGLVPATSVVERNQFCAPHRCPSAPSHSSFTGSIAFACSTAMTVPLSASLIVGSPSVSPTSGNATAGSFQLLNTFSTLLAASLMLPLVFVTASPRALVCGSDRQASVG